MADEISQVQKQGVNPLWPTAGAVIGGVGAYKAVDHFTKPKYDSWQRVIEDMKPDEFESSIKNAADADKDIVSKIEQVRNAKADAEAELNAQVKALQDASAKGAELPENHQALAELKDAKEKLEAKRNALIDEKIKKGAGVNAEELKALRQEEKLVLEAFKPQREAVRAINESLEKFAQEKSALANEYADAATTAERKLQIEKRLAKIQGEIANLANNKALGLNSPDAKIQFIKQMNNAVESMQSIAERDNVPVKLNVTAEQMKKYNEIKKAAEKKFKTISREIDKTKRDVYRQIETTIKNDDKYALEKALTRIPEEQANTIKEAYNAGGKQAASKAFRNAKSDLNTFFESRKQYLQSKKFAEVEELRLNNIFDDIKKAFANNDEKALEDAINKLPKDQKKFLLESKANFETVLNEVKESYLSEIKQFKALNETVAKVGGAGAKIGVVKDGGANVYRILDKDGNVVCKKYAPEGLETKVTLPKNQKLMYIEKRIAELKNPSDSAREEIAKGIKESELAEQLKAVKDAEAKVAEAKAQLPKAEVLTEEQALDKVLKDKGVATRKEYINNQIKEKTKGLFDEVKSLFERKHGFEGNFKTKAGIAAAAGAVILGGIFNILAPKRNS